MCAVLGLPEGPGSGAGSEHNGARSEAPSVLTRVRRLHRLG